MPVTDCRLDTLSYREHGDGNGLTASLMRWFGETYLPGLEGADEPDVSPLRVDDLAGVAPALVLAAEYDPLRDEGEEYARRLQAAGVKVIHTRHEGMIHGFLRMTAVLDRSKDAVAQIAGAVRLAL